MSAVSWKRPVRLPEPYRSMYVLAIGVFLLSALFPDAGMFTLAVSFLGGALGIAFVAVMLTRGFSHLLPRSWSESGFVAALVLVLILLMRTAAEFSWTGRVIAVVIGIGVSISAFHLAEVLHQRSISESSPRN